MSEQINKVLASTAQSFSTSEQAQARANIDAMAASASSEFAPASAGFSGVSSNNCITGIGTTSSPIGLSSKAKFENSLSSTVIGPNEIIVNNHVGTSYIGNSFLSFNVNYNGGATGYMNASSVRFTDSANNTELVDASSIQRWNSYTQISAGGDSATPVYISGGSAIPVTTCRYLSIRIDGVLANSFTASAIDMDIPLGNLQSSPAGTASYYVKYAGKMTSPYDVKLTLCCSGATTSTPASTGAVIIDNAYVSAGGDYFKLDGFTLGLGNNFNSTRTWVSAHFAEDPMSSTITIDDNIGWYMSVGTNPVGLVPRT